MAHQVRAQQVFRYRNFHINKSQQLGHGAYGAVYKAKCNQLPCAAKVLHPTILDPTDPGAGRIMQRFQQECAFLENIRHPNIVQYLGITRDPESRLPVLLMELLDESLTKMLEQSQKPLAYFVQVNICHDIALAVAYLHSNDIIHRDLSSNNVLIMAKSRAKVTDFGMSKLAGAAPSMTPLTMCPGTLAYMPPEALEEPPRYTKKLDCFSEGVMMIQVCTRLWPEPGPRTKTVQDSRSPTGRSQIPVLEQKRRKSHIDMIDHGHPLLPIAIDCFCYQENERPSSEELCERLTGLKETTEYGESIERVEMEQNDVSELERQIREMQVREEANVQHHQSELQLQQSTLQSKDQQLHQQERQIQRLNQQLEEQEQVTAEIQQTNHSLQRQVEQLQQQLSQQSQQNTKPAQPPPPVALGDQVRGRQHEQGQRKHSQPPRHRSSHVSTKRMVLTEWKDGRAPIAMRRGGAVVNGGVAYFMDCEGYTCSYNVSTKVWRELPKCSCWYSSLSVIRGLLTAIGGFKQGTDVQELFSIVKHKSTEWVEHFPPMPSKRCYTTAGTTNQHLIVAGGMSGYTRLNTVEVMSIETLVWSTAASLPHPYSSSSATICGDCLYMLGGYDNSGVTKSVLTCSLTELLQSHSPSVWSSVADVSVYPSTCADVNGELVAVGGLDERGKATSDVHKYNPTTDSWRLISHMPTARSHCLVAVLPTNEMIVVGGHTGISKTNKAEIATITYHTYYHYLF